MGFFVFKKKMFLDFYFLIAIFYIYRNVGAIKSGLQFKVADVLRVRDFLIDCCCGQAFSLLTPLIMPSSKV